MGDVSRLKLTLRGVTGRIDSMSEDQRDGLACSPLETIYLGEQCLRVFASSSI